MSTFYVRYSVYRPGSSEVITEGEMPINASTNYQAEQAVKAMFAGSEVVVRGTFNSPS
jgi:hypothetical protein